ncbi:protein kinase domain containing protein [Stylonychia lemnae]|uniref:Protein kinase domain containing protein n=1 Tax=Stylonychia lemnae TaxID=5949 RepID=A0A078A9V8_STYLE|nr:protein kinase domain containing protein [Stylonychia lemnae]|eukprot:CDW78357.1 protein kinase domain containing protein [Stylonychia lemnae]
MSLGGEEHKLKELPKVSKVREQILEFDLNQIFHLTYSFDVLKKVIDKIVFEVDNHSDKFSSAIDKLVNQVNLHDAKIQHQAKHLEMLSQQNDKQEKTIGDNTKQIEDLQKQMSNFKNYDDSKLLKMIEDLEHQITESNGRIKNFDEKFFTLKQGSNTNSNSQDELEEILNDLRQDMRERFVRREEFKEYQQQVQEKLDKADDRIQNLEDQVEDHEIRIKQLEDLTSGELKDQIQQIRQTLENMRQDLTLRTDEIELRLKDLNQELNNKVECEMFDEEINNLKAAINALATSGPDDVKKPNVTQVFQTTGMSSKDLNKLRELGQKVTEIDELIHKLLRDMKSLNINELRELINDALKKISSKASMEDLEKLKQEIREEFQAELDKIRTLINNFKAVEFSLRQEIQDIRSIPRTEISHKETDSQQRGSFNNEDLADILRRLAELEEAFKNYKIDNARAIQQILDQVAQKASIESLNELEQKILEKLNELFQALVSKFADKGDTKKAIKNLETSLKNLYEQVINSQNGNGLNIGHEDDAMFAKKPLGGWSCASCEKGLVNLQGLPAEYTPWSKLPFKDPNERLSKYGAGFSKILQIMKPEMTLHQNSTSQLQNSSQNLLSSKGFQNEDIAYQTHHQNLEVSNMNIRPSGPKTSHQMFKNASHDTILPNLKKEANFYSRLLMNATQFINHPIDPHNIDMHEEDSGFSVSTSVSKSKQDFALLRIQNDIKEYIRNKMPTKNCLTTISEFNASQTFIDRSRFFFSRSQSKSKFKQIQAEVKSSQYYSHNNSLAISPNIDSIEKQASNEFDQNQQKGQSLGYIQVEIRCQEGFYKNGLFIFHIYFLPKYPHVAPRVFLSDFQTQNNIMYQQNFNFVNRNTDEVQLKILQEQWSPVLSLQMILLALELQVGYEDADPGFNHRDLNNIDFQSYAYDKHLSLLPFVQNRHQNPKNQQLIDQVTSRKRKLQEMSSNGSGSNISSPISDIEGSFNPIKRLRRDLDDLRIQSPMSQNFQAMANPMMAPAEQQIKFNSNTDFNMDMIMEYQKA